MEIPADVMKRMVEKPYKETSIKKYVSTLKNTILKGCDHYDIERIINFKNEITDEMKMKSNYSTLINTVKVFLTASNVHDDIINEYNILACEAWELKPVIAKVNPDADNEMISMEEIKELLKKKIEEYEQLADKYIYNNASLDLKTRNRIRTLLMEIIFLKITTEVGALRSQDYYNSKYIDDGNFNYMDINNNKLIIKDGKVKKSKRTIELNEDIVHYIGMLKQINNDESEYVFTCRSDGSKEMNAKLFTKFINHLFGGRKISTNKCRHMVVKEMEESGASLFERKAMADTMGHSLPTAELKYNKYNK